MLSQNPCLLTLSFPDTKQPTTDKRVWILPFGYDTAGVEESSVEQVEDATFKALKKTKPRLIHLLAKSAELCLKDNPLSEVRPVLQSLANFQEDSGLTDLKLSMDFFTFQSHQDELGPGWARATVQGLHPSVAIEPAHITAALTLCINKFKAMGIPMLAAKSPEALLDFCEERTDEVPTAFAKGLMGHSLSLFAKGVSLSNYEPPSPELQRPLNVFWIQCNQPQSIGHTALAGLPINSEDPPAAYHSLIFWPAAHANDTQGKLKQKLQFMKAIMDAKNHHSLSEPAKLVLQKIGETIGIGGSGATATQSAIAAPTYSESRIDILNISQAQIEHDIPKAVFDEALKILTQSIALQMGPSCAMGGRSAALLSDSLQSQQLDPRQWATLSQSMKPMLDASPALKEPSIVTSTVATPSASALP